MEKPPVPNPEENLHELSEERKVFRETLKDEAAPESVREAAKENIAEIKEKLSDWIIENEGSFGKAKERIRKEKEELEKTAKAGLDERLVVESMGGKAETYEKIAVLSEKLESLNDFELRSFFEIKINPQTRAAREKLLVSAREEREDKEIELAALQKENPIEFRAHELVEDAEGLYKEGHIAPTKSVKDNLQRIGRNMMLGKPMFLHGSTGTGKTSIARFAAKTFTGKSLEMVYCNPQTRESSVWGKTGIRPTKEGAIETVDIYGPLAKAMSEGKVVIFDEFTALPKEQMVFIKGIFNVKVGDTVNVMG